VLGALFSVLNKRYVHVASPQTMMVYELSGGLTILSVLMPLYLAWFPVETILPSAQDWLWLLILAWLCTILAMDLMLQALKKVSAFTQKVSAFTQNLTLNLEPVYGILMAFFFFSESKDLRNSFYAGFTLIALSVVLQMWRVRRNRSVA
jgi:drug/metabolite transporter (DMT)-like permease